MKRFLAALVFFLWRLLLWFPPVTIVWRLWNTSQLLNFSITYGYIRTFRLIYIGGRYGGYKTALSMLIGYKLWSDGYVKYFYSNIRCVWNDDIELLPDLPNPLDINAVVVFDEAGQFFERRRDVKNLIAFLRKMKLILLLPSVEPPSFRVTRLSIEPMYIFTSIGLPLVVYRTTLKGSRRSDDRVSWFAWWQPRSTFGVYDTEDAPIDGKGLEYALVELKDKLATRITVESRFAKKHAAAQGGYELQQVALNTSPSDMPNYFDMGGEVEEQVDRLQEQLDRAADDGRKAKRGFGA
jgi:hypothetical protein